MGRVRRGQAELSTALQGHRDFPLSQTSSAPGGRLGSLHEQGKRFKRGSLLWKKFQGLFLEGFQEKERLGTGGTGMFKAQRGG